MRQHRHFFSRLAFLLAVATRNEFLPAFAVALSIWFGLELYSFDTEGRIFEHYH